QGGGKGGGAAGGDPRAPQRGGARGGRRVTPPELAPGPVIGHQPAGGEPAGQSRRRGRRAGLDEEAVDLGLAEPGERRVELILARRLADAEREQAVEQADADRLPDQEGRRAPAPGPPPDTAPARRPA